MFSSQGGTAPGVEDTGFGTRMMGRGRCRRTVVVGLSLSLSRVEASCSLWQPLRLAYLPSFRSLSLSALSLLLSAVSHPVSPSAVSAAAVAAAAASSPVIPASHLSLWSSPRKLKLPYVGVRASGAP